MSTEREREDERGAQCIVGIPQPALTISFIKEEGFKCTLKCGEGGCIPNPNWDLVPQELYSFIAEGSGSCSTFRDSRNLK